MADHPRLEGGEQEALFHSYPCALYYVQSPSAASHGNSSSSTAEVYHHQSTDSALLSPLPNEANRSTLSPYSSRGSNNAFLHEKKIAYDLQSQDSRLKRCSQQLQIIGMKEVCSVDGDRKRNSNRLRFISVDPSSSRFCVAFQLAWKLIASVGIAVLFFFLVTKPPAPNVAFKMVGFRNFELREGLDNTGVVTKILTCNSSMDMEIDNHSKVFGLYVHPPTIEMAFGRLKFGRSKGYKSYVPSYGSLTLRLYVGAKNIPVYGGGQNMQDMIQSGQGLRLMVHVESRTTYHIVWNIIRLRYHHRGICQLVLYDTFDEGTYTHTYNDSCITASSRA